MLSEIVHYLRRLNSRNDFTIRIIIIVTIIIIIIINMMLSYIAERPRCRGGGEGRSSQKWKTGTGRQYFTDIIGLSSTTVT